MSYVPNSSRFGVIPRVKYSARNPSSETRRVIVLQSNEIKRRFFNMSFKAGQLLSMNSYYYKNNIYRLLSSSEIKKQNGSLN